MASQLAEAYVTVSMNAEKMPSQLSGIKSQMASAIGDMANRFAMTGFVFRRLIDSAKEFAMAIAEDEEEAIRFSTAVEASGRGQSYVQMVEQIGRASAATTAFSEDAVRAAATAIAPFRTLSNEMAGRVLEAAKDLTAQFGGDLSSNARGLALALERPEVGMRRLRAMGVNLTAQQQEQIKTMLEMGQVAQAQEAILAIAAEKSAGAAEKMGGTLKGLYTRIKTELGEIAEAMGSMFSDNLKKVDEVVIKVLRGFREMLESDTLVGNIARMASGFLGLAMAGGMLGQALSTIKGLLFGTLGPLGWTLAAVVAVATQFVNFSDVLEWFGATWGKVRAALIDSGLWDRLAVGFNMLTESIGRVVSSVIGFDIHWKEMFSGLGDWVVWAIGKIGEFISSTVDAIQSLVEDAGIHWHLLENKAAQVMTNIIAYGASMWPEMTAGVIAFVKTTGAILQEWGEALIAIFEEPKARLAATVAYWRTLITSRGDTTAAIGAYEKAFKEAGGKNLGLGSSLAEGAGKRFKDEYESAIKDISPESLAEKMKGLKQEEDKLNAELSRRAGEREEERVRRIADRRQKEEEAVEDELYQAWMDMMDDTFKPESGRKPAKEKGLATGFVGIAEFAKQFQASVLKSDADRYAKETAGNTHDANEHLAAIKEQTKEPQTVFA